MIKQKKAFLLGTKTVLYVIAFLCILILIVLAVKVYNAFQKDRTESQQAKASLAIIEPIVLAAADDRTLTKEFFIESPNDWSISAWPYKTNGEAPKKCYALKSDYCVCICKFASAWDAIMAGGAQEAHLSRCNENNICFAVNKEIYTTYNGYIAPIKISGLTVLKISTDSGKIKLEHTLPKK